MAAEELQFELAGGPYAATAARLALSELDAHLDPVLAQDLRLLVSETVSNSVKHAGIGPEESLGLKVTLLADAVRVEVSDDGPQFDAEARPPTLDDVVEEQDPSGWGLFLVDQLADRWGVQREGGNTVWFELSTGDASAAA